MVDILHRVGMKSSLNNVYEALSTPEGIAGWWTTDTRGDGKVGGTFKVTFFDGDRELGAFQMKVLELDPNKRVRWQVIEGPEEWVGTKISFDLKREADYAIVNFKHEGWKEPGEFMHHCSTKWAVFLLSLKSLVETGKGAASPNDVKISDWH